MGIKAYIEKQKNRTKKLKQILLSLIFIFSASAYSQYNANIQENWDELMYAVANNDTVVIDQLVKAGADINKLYDERYTPFMYACENGLVESVKKILSFEGEYQADLRLFDPMSGQTGFMLAVWKGHKEIIIAILEKEPCEKNVHDFYDHTALDYTSDPEIIELLNSYNLCY